MEKHLLALYQYKNQRIPQSQLAAHIGLSQKQLSRNLARWQSEGILDYVSGKGRSRYTVITWHKDIEVLYYHKIKQLLNKGDLEEALPYLSWPWSALTHQKLLTKSNKLLGFAKTSQNEDKLTITKRHSLLSTRPFEVLEAKNASVLMSVFDTLFKVKEDETIEYHLAHHYEYHEHAIDIYLRPLVKFHDGSYLSSIDVKRSLEHARSHQHTADLLEQITHIELIDELALRIHFNKCPQIVALLSHLSLAIYKETEGRHIGTGPYFIKHDNQYTTILKRFNDYYGHAAFIDEIELVYIPEVRKPVIGDSDEPTTTLTKNIGFYYMCQHPDSTLTSNQKQYIKAILKNEYHLTVDRQAPKILGNSNYLKQKEILRPAFDEPIRIDCIEINDAGRQAFDTIFSRHQIAYELINHTFDDSIGGTIQLCGDYYFFGEYLDIPETLAYHHFIFGSSSSIHRLMSQYSWFNLVKSFYQMIPYNSWDRLNRLIDRKLDQHAILYPLYIVEDSITFARSLHGVSLNQYGFINFNQIWRKKSD
ncbi:ABC transporter substrate-binding protein [Macrococcus brunensis]|uniref:ABC transporter substrate-binding protein n=1 Tax=Macrococcus brunensis TaxID=198483 RepID=UPI001EF118B4|nr:ABC transporter substrate-binding protein [Macrococcus brunensis]ULG74567.1 ABC transporter substrate-binding protein [Macrococcus brunensis]